MTNEKLAEALRNVLAPLDLYHAYGWADRDGVREKARAELAAHDAAQPTQPARELTDDEILDVPAGINNGSRLFLLRFARAVIAADRALREGGPK